MSHGQVYAVYIYIYMYIYMYVFAFLYYVRWWVYIYIYICICTRYVIQVDVTCSGHPPYNICIYIYIYMFRKVDEQRGIDVHSSGHCYICMYSIHVIHPYISVYMSIYIYI